MVGDPRQAHRGRITTGEAVLRSAMKDKLPIGLGSAHLGHERRDLSVGRERIFRAVQHEDLALMAPAGAGARVSRMP